jgi:hypothetical protein
MSFIFQFTFNTWIVTAIIAFWFLVLIVIGVVCVSVWDLLCWLIK